MIISLNFPLNKVTKTLGKAVYSILLNHNRYTVYFQQQLPSAEL